MKHASAPAALMMLLLLAGCETLTSESNQSQVSDKNYLDTYNQALAAYQAGDLASAEPLFLELTRAVPREADSWFRLGNIYARTQRPDLAVANYREAVLRKPDMSKAWHNMGVVQLRQAAKSFVELRQRIEATDSLFDTNQRLTDGVLELLDGGPNKASQ